MDEGSSKCTAIVPAEYKIGVRIYRHETLLGVCGRVEKSKDHYRTGTHVFESTPYHPSHYIDVDQELKVLFCRDCKTKSLELLTDICQGE